MDRKEFVINKTNAIQTAMKVKGQILDDSARLRKEIIKEVEGLIDKLTEGVEDMKGKQLATQSVIPFTRAYIDLKTSCERVQEKTIRIDFLMALYRTCFMTANFG